MPHFALKRPKSIKLFKRSNSKLHISHPIPPSPKSSPSLAGPQKYYNNNISLSLNQSTNILLQTLLKSHNIPTAQISHYVLVLLYDNETKERIIEEDEIPSQVHNKLVREGWEVNCFHFRKIYNGLDSDDMEDRVSIESNISNIFNNGSRIFNHLRTLLNDDAGSLSSSSASITDSNDTEEEESSNRVCCKCNSEFCQRFDNRSDDCENPSDNDSSATMELCKATVLCDFPSSSNENELSVYKNETLVLYRKSNHWIYAENSKGARGWVPIWCVRFKRDDVMDYCYDNGVSGSSGTCICSKKKNSNIDGNRSEYNSGKFDDVYEDGVVDSELDSR